MNIYNFQTYPFYNNNSKPDYEYYNNRWTPDNQDAKYTRATSSPTVNNTSGSDFWIRNTSYLRLKTPLWLHNSIKYYTAIRIKNIRLYIAGQNLITFSNLKFMDRRRAIHLLMLLAIQYEIIYFWCQYNLLTVSFIKIKQYDKV